MTVELTQPDFQALVKLVQTQNEFGSSRDRRRFIANAIEGFDKSNTILSRIDFDGNSMGVATELIRFLINFGQVAPGREALGVFLDHLLANIGFGENADYIADIVEKYALNSPLPAPAPTQQPLPSMKLPDSEEYIFISYARPDQTFAEQAETFFTEIGTKVFRDIKDISSGANWDMTIEKALSETTRMILLLSVASMPYRKEVHREWFYFDQKQKPIHPIYIQDCTLHSRMLAYNYIDGTTDYEKALNQVLKHIINKNSNI